MKNIVCILIVCILCIVVLYITNPVIENMEDISDGNIHYNDIPFVDINKESSDNINITELSKYDPYNKQYYENYNTIEFEGETYIVDKTSNSSIKLKNGKEAKVGDCLHGEKILYNWDNTGKYSYKCVDACTNKNEDMYYYRYNENKKGLKLPNKLKCCDNFEEKKIDGKYICVPSDPSQSTVSDYIDGFQKVGGISTRIPPLTSPLTSTSPPPPTPPLTSTPTLTTTPTLIPTPTLTTTPTPTPTPTPPLTTTPTPPLTSTNTEKQKAIIMFRHGQKGTDKDYIYGDICSELATTNNLDYLKNNTYYSDANKYLGEIKFTSESEFVNEKKIYYANISLTGYSQGIAYSNNIPKIIEDNNLAKIKKVYIFNPTDNANSYLVAYPLLQKLVDNDSNIEITSFIKDDNSYKDIKNSIKNSTGSILVVSENDSLERISEMLYGEKTLKRGRDIYVYRYNGITEDNELDFASPEQYVQNSEESYIDCAPQGCIEISCKINGYQENECSYKNWNNWSECPDNTKTIIY